ncbi:MAG: nucleotidyl transferase AbiEii/AbiGii toxin family protein, partial [Caldisericaceae bacterium]|nr:nucleotidyl transferase AbiEii/AbiGii toxin family protein [Caldisericaceae bacterium]
MDSSFIKQTRLMLRILPIINKEKVFALKGGTAINFFVRDMPRVSVDIDIVYLPVSEREKALKEISRSLDRISVKVQRMFPEVVVTKKKSESRVLTKLIIRLGGAVTKIEPNLVLRGSVYPVEKRALVRKAQNLFEIYLEMTTLSIADLYGGKICAALDRQHPRDFFDIKVFFENEEFNDEIRKAFIVYLISHNRPMLELLNPNF